MVQSENEILLKSNLVLDQLISSIRLQLPALYSCVELLSLLDFFTSLAFYASRSNTGWFYLYLLLKILYKTLQVYVKIGNDSK